MKPAGFGVVVFLTELDWTNSWRLAIMATVNHCSHRLLFQHQRLWGSQSLSNTAWRRSLSPCQGSNLSLIHSCRGIFLSGVPPQLLRNIIPYSVLNLKQHPFTMGNSDYYPIYTFEYYHHIQSCLLYTSPSPRD